MTQRLLVLTPGADQQNQAFLDAAAKLQLEVVFGSECPQELPPQFRESALPLRFDDRDSILRIVEYAMQHPLAAMVSVGDAPLSIASRAASMLGLPCHPPHAADAMADSDRLRAAGIVPSATTAVTADALVDGGKLRVFALFDWDEDIAVTPTRRPPELQIAMVKKLQSAVQSLGLRHGPLHAHIALRDGEPVLSSLAARAIRAPASRALRFRIPLIAAEMSLEEFVVRLALGNDLSRIFREDAAAGYAKLRSGRITRALAVDGIQEIVHSCGAGYAFARGKAPEEVERILREASAAMISDPRQ